MDAAQRRTLALAADAVAVVLLLFCHVRPSWARAAWDGARGTLDLGIVRISNHPPLRSDARSVLAGLVLPIVLAATGRVLQGARPDGR